MKLKREITVENIELHKDWNYAGKKY